MTERLEAAPGIAAANAIDITPLTLSNNADFFMRDGDSALAPDQRPALPMVYLNAVGPGHFKTLAIPMVDGRDFTTFDTETAPSCRHRQRDAGAPLLARSARDRPAPPADARTGPDPWK